VSARSVLEFSDGAAGPVLSLVPAADPRDNRWWHFAACQGADVNDFYIEDGVISPAVQRTCAGCPVRLQCLEDALALPEAHDFGYWGGMPEHQRRLLRRRRARRAA
jgi:WhiB family redox-sensing transcriptional regulator